MEGKIVSVVIEENGDLTFLDTDAERVFLELGTAVTRRASHVEPVFLPLRLAFYILRWFGDKNKIADWTRNWKCGWRVNTDPVGGPILRYSHLKHNASMLKFPAEDWDGVAVWRNRQEAIEAEIEFLNDWFLERN